MTSCDPSPLAVATAVDAWSSRLGSKHVRIDAALLGLAATATFATWQRPIALLFPGNRDDVVACLKIAADNRVPLYPVSSGRNWGFGSSVPASGGCAILHLSRLDRILDFNEKLAYVTVEPGVTFRRLHEFLQKRAPGLFASVTGGSPDASVIGNTLERGDGTGPYGDHAAHVCGLEIVLASGEVLRTGHARFDAARTAALHRYGVGSSLDGLFMQSNLGVVTRMTVWLAPYPAAFERAILVLRDDARLEGLFEALRRLRLEGTVRSPIGIWNDYKFLATAIRYPWELTNGETPLGRSLAKELAEGAGFGRWMGAVTIYGASAQQGLADRQRVDEVLQGTADLIAWDAGPPAVPWTDLTRRGPALGVPHEGSLASMYWRRKVPVPGEIDPHADGCGFIWCTFVVPFAGKDIWRATSLAEEIVLHHGFEPQLALIAATERAVLAAISIVYDRTVVGQDAAAMACHNDVFDRLVGAGYYPSRLGLQSMARLPRAADDSALIMRKIKDAIDPAGIISPGRYEG